LDYLLVPKKKPIREEIVTKNAEEYLKAKMNNAKSYEFVKLVLINSVLYSDNIQYRKEAYSKYLEDEIKR
jgi:hypothetical protein